MPKRKAEKQISAEEPEDVPDFEGGETDEDEEASDGDEGNSEDTSGDSSSGDDDSLPDVSTDDDVAAGSDEDEEDPDEGKDIIVDFEFFDPSEKDFHGAKALLGNYLDGEAFDSSSMVDAIISQSEVGTVVKTASDDDPVGVMSVLSTAQHGGKAFMQQALAWLRGKCPDIAEQLQAAWSAPGTGLIVNERLMNSPPSVAPPLLQSLMDEVHWASEDGTTQEERDTFKFKRYILATRVYSDPLEQQQHAAGPSTSRGKKKGPVLAPGAAPVLVYVRPEDQFMHQRAAWSHAFPVEGRAVAKDELIPMRLVMMVEAGAMKAVQKELDAVLGNPMREQGE